MKTKKQYLSFSTLLLYLVLGHIFGNNSLISAEGNITKDGSATLKFLGHASVKIQTSDNKVIYIDPYAGSDYTDSADVVLVTHQHSDHSRLSLIKQKKSCVVISNFQAIQNGSYKSFTLDNIKIDAVAAYNGNHSAASCVGYILEFDGIKIYHAGDTGKINEFSGLASREITYALLPMDGTYTMTPEEAVEVASMIKAKYYIPIHTMTALNSYDDPVAARFKVPNKIVVLTGQTINLNNPPTSVGSLSPKIPNNILLCQNYPNPFNPNTLIGYQLHVNCFVTIKIHDVLGREIVTLVKEFQDAGSYSIDFSASNNHLTSGVYIYTLSTEKSTQSKKMLLIE